jgi:membrane-associated phospholipid phosphatase
MTGGPLRRLLTDGRSLGVTELLHGEATWPVLVLFGVVSQLGDVWFLFLLGGVVYVSGELTPRLAVDRRRGLFVLALLLTYLALVGTLKSAFALGRPPGATLPPASLAATPVLGGIPASITTASGSGFPSGHALGTTMVWGGAALVVDSVSPRRKLAVVLGVVGLVSASRLVLGLHYLVDVVVGAAVGALVLGGLYRLSARGTDPGRVLAVAVAVGGIGLALAPTFESVATLGGAVGAWLVWRAVAREVEPHPSDRREVVAGVAVLLGAGAAFGAVYALEPVAPLTFVGTGLAAGVAVGTPLLGERFA